MIAEDDLALPAIDAAKRDARFNLARSNEEPCSQRAGYGAFPAPN